MTSSKCMYVVCLPWAPSDHDPRPVQIVYLGLLALGSHGAPFALGLQGLEGKRMAQLNVEMASFAARRGFSSYGQGPAMLR